MIRRRRLVQAMGVASLLPVGAFAQTAARTYRLGILGFGDSAGYLKSIAPYLGLLAQHDLVEGRNLVLEVRTVASETQPMDAAAAELAAAKCDAIFVASPGGAFALRKATSTVPIVIMVGFDPVAAGLINSFARPGGNVTGVTLLSVETGNKRLELLMEAFPATRRVYYLNQKGNMQFFDASHADRLRIAYEPLAIENAGELAAFFARPLPAGTAIDVATSSVNFILRQAIAEHANRARVPAVFPYVEAAEAGGLLAYASDLRAATVRLIDILARVLKGAKPAETPFERAAKVVLVVNLRTARETGLSIPQSVLLRADRVIE